MRKIRIEYKDGSHKDLEIAKATKLKGKMMWSGALYLDRLKEGWRIIFSEDIADDFSQIDQFKIIRED